MNAIITFLQKRPSDLTIRLGRIVFGIIYVVVLYLNFFVFEPKNTIQNDLFWVDITSFKNIVMYVIVALGIIPIITGITDFCFMKSGKVRILQIIYAIILFYIVHIIESTAVLDIDTLVFLLAFIPLFGGITGKIITIKGSNYGYKVVKVRV